MFIISLVVMIGLIGKLNTSLCIFPVIGRFNKFVYLSMMFMLRYWIMNQCLYTIIE
jgi:hypothetical protein